MRVWLSFLLLLGYEWLLVCLSISESGFLDTQIA